MAELEREEQRTYGHIRLAAKGGLAAKVQSAEDRSSPLAVTPEEARRLGEAANRAEEREKMSFTPLGGPTTGNA